MKQVETRLLKIQVFPRSFLLRVAGCLSFLVLGSGCAPEWHADSGRYLHPYEAGDLKTAVAESIHCADAKAQKDDFLFNLDAGALLRATGNLPESTSRLDYADSLVGDYQQWPDLRLSEELVAAVSSARTVTYRGSLSDLVMLNSYRALNHMESGNNSGARSMLIKASFVQQDIAQRYAADLRKAQDDSANQSKQDSSQFDTGKSVAVADQQTHAYAKDLLNLKVYANYVNPFCDYIQGVFFLGAALDQSDKERAATAFKRASSMEPTNPYILQDIADADAFANGQPLKPVTYVLFETGMAPELGQIQVPLPLFLANNQAPTVVLYFPTIKLHGNFLRSLDVQTAQGIFHTVVVSDMDSVIVQEFKNNLSTVITRMVIAAATKAAIDAGIRQAIKGQNAYVQLGYDLLSAGYQIETGQADLRCWRTLPEQFQVARFATPPDGTLTLVPPDGPGQVRVGLKPGTVNVVYVKSVRRGLPLIVRQFVLSSTEAAPQPTAPPLTGAASN